MARRRTGAVAARARFPTETVLRLVKSVAALLLILLVVLGGAAAFLTYRIATARNLAENITPQSSFQTNYASFDFKDRKGGEHEGWLLLGLKGAPVIILCHGYESNRSEMLSLGSMLRQNHFNVYLFNFEGPKAKRAITDLGIGEAEIVLAAIEAVTQQPGINPNRVGLFGATTGGFAALAAAQRSPKVKTIVVDTVYEKPQQMFEAQIDRLVGGSSFLFRLLAGAEFAVLTLGRDAPEVAEELAKLENVPKLFISGRDTPSLAGVTERLYDRAPQPKRLLVLEHSQAALASGAEKKEYENQVLSFFLHNLPLRAD